METAMVVLMVLMMGHMYFMQKDMNNMHKKIETISQEKHNMKTDESKSSPSKTGEGNENHPQEHKHTH